MSELQTWLLLLPALLFGLWFARALARASDTLDGARRLVGPDARSCVCCGDRVGSAGDPLCAVCSLGVTR